jgi:hypothetical protein
VFSFWHSLKVPTEQRNGFLETALGDRLSSLKKKITLASETVAAYQKKKEYKQDS